MYEVFGYPVQALAGQLLLGLVNGSFYALLSLGLAIIFGMLGIVNFAHGVMFMIGAHVAYMASSLLGLNYWAALLLAPVIVGALAIVVEQTLLRRLYKIDPLYNMLLTFGLAMVAEGLFRQFFGVSGHSVSVPSQLQGATNLGFMVMPIYRVWVILASITVCLVTWYAVEKTRFGSVLRAGTENPVLTQAFGINVPRIVMWTYGGGAALAALAGVFASPIMQVTPLMGSNLLIIVFAVVVIGGMGSILGSILTGLVLGLLEGIAKVIYPEAASIVVFLIMVVVLLVSPTGIFGKER
ncbi:branched-chain amino acid ABC transporter permease [Allorhizobium pseudoryzae]|uniref:branched-chain amino acid ABC transporter permease n=1 Tax=Allorhizobium pseudoryzae TaxID=379684 RepID=UPI003D06C6E6